MASAAPNPYAPPAEAEPAAEPSGLWSVQGEYLLVRPGAWLPPVDLEGDGTGTDLTPVSRTFQVAAGRKGILLLFLPILIIPVWMILSRRFFGSDGLFVGVFLSVILSRLFAWGGGSGIITAVVRGYSSVAFLQAGRRRKRLISVVNCCGVFLMLGSLVAVGLAAPMIARNWDAFSGPFFFTGLVIAVVLWLVPGFLLTLKPGLRCVRFRDGWLYLKGVPASSLAALASYGRETPPPPKKARVFVQHLWRQPLGTLLGKQWWNPWSILVLAILKARRSPRLDRLCFHWSEVVRRPVEEADPSLREAWARESAGTEAESWTPVCAEWIDSPQGDLRIESLVHLSPDRKHAASMVQVRISSGKYYAEIRQTAFRSRVAGGNCLLTSSPPLVPVHPDFLKAEQCRGGLGKILARHLERAASREPIPFASRDEVIDCMDREAAGRTASQEAYGLQEAPEEQEIPGWSVFPPGKNAGDHSPPTEAMR